MPGAEFLYDGKRYILTGNKNGGTIWKADGLPTNGVNRKKCILVRPNAGLVFM